MITNIFPMTCLEKLMFIMIKLFQVVTFHLKKEVEKNIMQSMMAVMEKKAIKPIKVIIITKKEKKVIIIKKATRKNMTKKTEIVKNIIMKMGITLIRNMGKKDTSLQR